MAENIIYADLNLPESATPRVQQVSDVPGSTYAELKLKSRDTNDAKGHTSAGKCCGSRPRVAVLVAVLVVTILLLVLAECLVHSYYPTARSQQQSTALSPSPEEALGCPPQWKIHGKKCYFFNPKKKKKDWNASRAECTTMGADLVIIDNKDELDYLMEQSGYRYYFLGLTYSEREQKWKWMNNVEHDPALFKIKNSDYRDYHCTAIGHGDVATALCGGSRTTQNMCEKRATISESRLKRRDPNRNVIPSLL
ncbi:C-type lectin domain family 5 member A-like [Pithys albifrons albifrons]|uniref:C-type lectin domain family 5 member A-like n=1 Tax=Pithys albifrons albifrons TaxID=3385563 RepID=UPI003A5CCE3A